MSMPTTRASMPSSALARVWCTRTASTWRPGRHPGPFGPIQGDRDPAAPAGVETGYPHAATVAHRPRSRHFLRRGSYATGGRAARVSSWPRALSASLVIGPHMPRAAGPAPSTCVPPRFPAVPVAVRGTGPDALSNLVAVLELAADGQLRCAAATRRPLAATVRLVEDALVAGDYYDRRDRGRARRGVRLADAAAGRRPGQIGRDQARADPARRGGPRRAVLPGPRRAVGPLAAERVAGRADPDRGDQGPAENRHADRAGPAPRRGRRRARRARARRLGRGRRRCSPCCGRSPPRSRWPPAR